MGAPVHFEMQLSPCLCQPLCENQRGCDAIEDIAVEVEMTPDESEVTCAKCLEALGYAPEQLTEVERLEPGRIAA